MALYTKQVVSKQIHRYNGDVHFINCEINSVSAVLVQLMYVCYDVVLTGTEQFSRYSGYSDTYRWDGNHDDQMPRCDAEQR